MRFVFLDLDETIFDFKKAEHEALKNTLTSFGINPDAQICSLYSRLNDAQWKRLERGEITLPQVKTGRFELLFDELGMFCDVKLVVQEYEKNLSGSHFFIPGAEDFLVRMSRKYRLELVSNGTESVQVSRIRGAGIEKYFDRIFISQRIGHFKPAKEFFDYCFENISGFSKPDSVIMGDSLTSDISGGINSGLKTIWFNRDFSVNNTSVKPDHEVHSFEEAELTIDSM